MADTRRALLAKEGLLHRSFLAVTPAAKTSAKAVAKPRGYPAEDTSGTVDFPAGSRPSRLTVVISGRFDITKLRC